MNHYSSCAEKFKRCNYLVGIKRALISLYVCSNLCMQWIYSKLPFHSKWSWPATAVITPNMTTEKITIRISCLFIFLSASKKKHEIQSFCSKARCSIQTNISHSLVHSDEKVFGKCCGKRMNCQNVIQNNGKFVAPLDTQFLLYWALMCGCKWFYLKFGLKYKFLNSCRLCCWMCSINRLLGLNQMQFVFIRFWDALINLETFMGFFFRI